MIFEDEMEKKAFDFVCSLAEEATDRICTDLSSEDSKTFSVLLVPTDDEGKTVWHKPTQTYDILYWLKNREHKISTDIVDNH